MSEAKHSKTQAYVLFPKHIQMIAERSEETGGSSQSAALRSILNEWDKNRKSAQAQTAAAIRQ